MSLSKGLSIIFNQAIAYPRLGNLILVSSGLTEISSLHTKLLFVTGVSEFIGYGTRTFTKIVVT